MIWILDICLALLVMVNLKLRRDLAYPGLLQGLIWLLFSLVFSVYQQRFIEIDPRVLVMIFSGVLLFSIGAFVATIGHKPYLKRNFLDTEGSPRPLSMTILMILVPIGFILFASRAFWLATNGPNPSMFVNLRYSLSVTREQTGGFGILAYFVPLANVFAVFALINFLGKGKLEIPILGKIMSGTFFFEKIKPELGAKLILAFAVSLAAGYAFMSSGRGFFVILMIILVGILMILRTARLVPILLAFVTLSLLTFAVGGILLNKGGSLQKNLSENIGTMHNSFVVYTAGSIPALSTALNSDASHLESAQFGAHTFRTFYRVMDRFGADVDVAPLVPEFARVPMLTNAYTIYYPYIKDFGIAAALSFQLLFGFFHGFIYKKATMYMPSSFYVFLFAITLPALTSQPGGDAYFMLTSTWVQYLFYGAIFLLIPWKKIFAKGMTLQRKVRLTND